MPKYTVRVVARIIAKSDRIEQLKTVLSQIVEPTRKESGCIQYDLLHNAVEPTDFTFVEEWETEAALEAHLQSAHIQTALREVESLVASPPDIRRYLPII
jgi:quinol monooxygenase YgiN